MGAVSRQRLVTVRTEELTGETRTAIVRLCVAAFRSDEFERMFTHIPSGGRHFLAFDRDTLVSHAVVTTRWLQPEQMPELKTAYVDAVATLPSVQRQGFGTAVMEHLAANVSDYAIAALKTARPDFYARLGWSLWRGRLAGRGPSGVVPTPEQKGVMVLRLPQTPSINLESDLTIECQSSRIW